MKNRRSSKKGGDPGLRGALRREYFAANGDVSRWRGRSVRFTDRKKKADREACRKWKED